MSRLPVSVRHRAPARLRTILLGAALALAVCAVPASALEVASTSVDGSTVGVTLTGLNTQPSYSYTDGNCTADQGALEGVVYSYGSGCLPPADWSYYYCDGGYYYYYRWSGCDNPDEVTTYQHVRYVSAPYVQLNSVFYDDYYYGGYYYAASGVGGQASETVSLTGVGPGRYWLYASQSCGQYDYGTKGTFTYQDYYYGYGYTYPAQWAASVSYCQSYNQQAFDLLAPPSFVQGAANYLQDHDAYLYAEIKPYGFNTDWHIEYGTDATYGQRTADQTVYPYSNAAGHWVYGGLNGLEPGTTYHWRIVATSLGGTLVGPDQTFTTTGTSDHTPPVITTPGDQAAEATGAAGAAVTFAAVAANDDKDGAVPVSCDRASGETFALGTTTVTCTATDAHGNSAEATFAVKVADTTPPALTVPDGQTLEATGPDGAKAELAAATATDVVDATVTASCDRASGETFALGTTTVTCTATDAHGNTSGKSFEVTVKDTTPPAVTAAPDATAEATGPSGAEVSFADPTATDVVNGTVAATCDPASGTTFAVGATEVTCSATDAAGNTGHDTLTVTVTDTTPPSLEVPAVTTVEATGPDGAAAEIATRAHDLVDGAVDVTCSPASGSTFALGTTDVSCSAGDAHGNTASGAGKVIVVDTTGPDLGLKDVTVEATSPLGAVASYSVTPKDLVDGAVAASCTPASGIRYKLGATTVTCSSTDKAGNTSTGTFAVNVVDTTAPRLYLPDDLAVTAGDEGRRDDDRDRWRDGGHARGEDQHGRWAGYYGLSYAYGGEQDRKSWNVTQTAAPLTRVGWRAYATDRVDLFVKVVCTPASGSQFAVGTTTVTCTATDKAGNTATGTFKVNVTYDWSGLDQPFRAGKATVRAGRTVDVRFELTGDSRGINAPAIILVGPQGGTLAPVASTTDATIAAKRGSYRYTLATKGMAPGVYTVRVDFGDGAPHDSTLTITP